MVALLRWRENRAPRPCRELEKKIVAKTDVCETSLRGEVLSEHLLVPDARHRRDQLGKAFSYLLE